MGIREKMELEIEKASLKAWPALECIENGDWILRFANGYTKRANSVTVLGGAHSNIDEKIRYCESQYKSRNLKPIFRLPSFVNPEGLDKALERKGFNLVDPTLVMRKKLAEKTPRDCSLSQENIDNWLKIFNQFTDANPDNEEKHLGILNSISSKTLFAVHRISENTVSCGLGVLENEYFGVFDLATDQKQQRKGYATILLSKMLDWAKNSGAKTAYLQVTQSNAPALSLYQNLGFSKLYEYWYRVKNV